MNAVLRASVVLAAMAIVSVGCGSATTPRPDVNTMDVPVTDTGTIVDTATDATTDTANGIDAPAPIDTGAPDAVPPDASSPCGTSPPSGACTRTQEGLFCSYGTDPRAGCRTSAECTAGQWVLQAPRCVALGTCPALAPATASMCSDEGTVCAYRDGTRCHCTSCPGGPCGTMPVWACIPPPSARGCPTSMPNAGELCTTEGADCDYGGCNMGFHLQCANGIWVNARTACPL